MRIAVLFTSHNRKRDTTQFLRFWSEFTHKSFDIQIIGCDDGSTDGTSDVIKKYCDSYYVGSGALFWAGGMRHAFTLVNIDDFDAIVVANDDIILSESRTREILDSYVLQTTDILVGQFSGKDGEITYGGLRRNAVMRTSFRISKCGESLDTLNMNFAIINSDVFKVIGFLDPNFRHSKADLDFGLRAKRHGFDIASFGKTLGICNRNSSIGTSKDPELPAVKRWRLLLSIKEQPIKERVLFCRRHGGIIWPLLVIQPYVTFGIKLLAEKLFRKAIPNIRKAD